MQWGVGSQADAPAFRTVRVGRTPVELIFGEHPHSRQDNNIYARWPDGHIEEFDGNYICVSVELTETNYLKQSGLSGNEVRKGGSCVIKFDGEPVYEFFLRNAVWALHHAAELIPKLQEHPLAPFDKVVGRKVYYRDWPGVITMWIGDQGAVVVESEDGTPFPAPPWRERDDDARTSVKEDILSEHFWWYRD